MLKVFGRTPPPPPLAHVNLTYLPPNSSRSSIKRVSNRCIIRSFIEVPARNREYANFVTLNEMRGMCSPDRFHRQCDGNKARVHVSPCYEITFVGLSSLLSRQFFPAEVTNQQRYIYIYIHRRYHHILSTVESLNPKSRCITMPRALRLLVGRANARIEEEKEEDDRHLSNCRFVSPFSPPPSPSLLPLEIRMREARRAIRLE